MNQLPGHLSGEKRCKITAFYVTSQILSQKNQYKFWAISATNCKPVKWEMLNCVQIQRRRREPQNTPRNARTRHDAPMLTHGDCHKAPHTRVRQRRQRKSGKKTRAETYNLGATGCRRRNDVKRAGKLGNAARPPPKVTFHPLIVILKSSKDWIYSTHYFPILTQD